MKKNKSKKTLRYRLASLVRLLTGKPRPKTAAIILAGGSGTRFGGDRPKQLTELLGIPVIIRSALAFEACPYIDETVIVSRDEDIDEIRALCTRYAIRKLKCVTAGGATRQESSMLGVRAAGGDAEFVAIHDAARCLVTADTVSAVAAEAYVYGGASAVGPVYDTVKKTDSLGFIKETVDRSSLVAAQTPQIFRKSLYLAAAELALRESFSVTDDNSLLERLGQAVKAVESRGENFKITTAEDMLRAEAVLRARADEGRRRDGDTHQNRARV